MDLLPELTFAWTNRNVSLLPSNSLWNLHDTIDSFYKCSVEIEQSARMRRWHQRQRESWKGTEKANYRWLRNETKDDAEYIRHNNENIIERQLQLEAITTEWMTVFQEYRDNPPPEWTAYLTEYHQDIPKGIAGNTPLDQDKYYRRLQKPNDEKAGSFDFWATKEAKRLPVVFSHAACVVFTSIEHYGNWPAHLLEVPVALPPKKGPPSALNQRPITCLSVWVSTWSSVRYDDYMQWQLTWLPPELCARPSSFTRDITWGLTLQVENAKLKGIPKTGLLQDKEKLFDLMVWEISLGMLTHSNGPSGIVIALRGLYGNLRSRFRSIGFVSAAWKRTNGGPQGCSWSTVCANLHIATFTNRVKRRIPTSMVGGYYDDTNTLTNGAPELQIVLKEVQTSDQKAGTRARLTKSVLYITDESLQEEVKVLEIMPSKVVTLVEYDALLGVMINSSNVWKQQLQDERAGKLSRLSGGYDLHQSLMTVAQRWQPPQV